MTRSLRNCATFGLFGLALAGLGACASTGGSSATDAAHESAPVNLVTATARSTTAPPHTSTPAQPKTAVRPVAGSAAHVLAGLRVAGRSPMTGYSREQFGPAWADVNRNGCDTRNDILTRDLSDKVYKPGTNGCVVLSGTITDPYTRSAIHFVRGGRSEIDIDHVVALGNAWVTGAARLPYATRVALANDPLNLLAVDSSANRQKGDGDAATWLPANGSFRCRYVARQIGVKDKYGLYVTPSEKQAMERVLATCPGEPVAVGGGPVDSGFVPPTPAPAATTKRTASSGGSRLDPQFPTCRAAKAAGYGPYVRGKDPEYAWYIDRDKDGIVCE